jgi:hypothetical protein
MRLIVLCVVMIIFLSSCTTRQVTPSRASRRAIDTIFQQEILLEQPKWDSMCLHWHDSLFTLVVDSILTVRQHEMNELVK